MKMNRLSYWDNKDKSHDGIVHSFAFLIEESSEAIDKVKWITA